MPCGASVCLPVLDGNSAEIASTHDIFERYVKIVMLLNGFENKKNSMHSNPVFTIVEQLLRFASVSALDCWSSASVWEGNLIFIKTMKKCQRC